jgi:uncharacterized protein (UPF0276 family)
MDAREYVNALPVERIREIHIGWSMEQVRGGAWGRPWVVAFEYGGVAPLWEAMTKRDVLREQVPRLHEMVKTSSARF